MSDAVEQPKATRTEKTTEDEAPSAAPDADEVPAGGEDEEQVFDFGAKKKKKGTKKKKEGGEDADAALVNPDRPDFTPGKIHPYSELLTRIQDILHQHNPELATKKRYTMKPPQMVRVGSKKVAWINFKEICDLMKRAPEHVFQYVLAELGTEGSIAGDDQLVLKGKYAPKDLESLLRRYITEYVTCLMCKSPETALRRDPSTRLYTIICSACGAHRTVTAIKSGFHAVSRADRRKAKQAK